MPNFLEKSAQRYWLRPQTPRYYSHVLLNFPALSCFNCWKRTKIIKGCTQKTFAVGRKEDLFSADKGGGGLFRCERPHFLLQKHRIFRNLWCVHSDKGEGVEPVRTWREGSIFRNFVQTSFMDGP